MRDDAKQAKEGNGQYLVQLSLTKAKEIHFSYLKPYQSKSTYAQYVTLEIKIGWRKVNDAGLDQQNRFAISQSLVCWGS